VITAHTEVISRKAVHHEALRSVRIKADAEAAVLRAMAGTGAQDLSTHYIAGEKLGC
jgi:hypothetical protein